VLAPANDLVAFALLSSGHGLIDDNIVLLPTEHLLNDGSVLVNSVFTDLSVFLPSGHRLTDAAVLVLTDGCGPLPSRHRLDDGSVVVPSGRIVADGVVSLPSGHRLNDGSDIGPVPHRLMREEGGTP